MAIEGSFSMRTIDRTSLTIVSHLKIISFSATEFGVNIDSRIGKRMPTAYIYAILLHQLESRMS